MKSVFLSSTARDLAKYREAVYRAIEGLDGYHCVCMEDFGARDWEADDFCRAKVAECDLFVGIVGHLYGSCPPASDQSYTEREYEAAVAAGIPRLMFIAPEDFPLPANLIEPDEKRHKQRTFRERVSQARIRDTFTSPDDLARRVVQAIRNWEQEQAAAQLRPLVARAEGVMPLPPQPYFAHPYPLQEHFTGRVRERQMLTEWLAEDHRPVLALIALGGMGKSALTWAWLQRDVLGLPLPGLPHDPPEVTDVCRVPENARPEGVLWWSFYDSEARFAAFLDEALTYASRGSVDPAAILSTYEKVKALVNLLQQHRLLLVLDGFERELRAYASLSAAYQGDVVTEDEHGDFRACTDLHAANFLRWAAAGPLQSRVLLTSRLFPRELDDLAGCRQEELTALDPEDAVAFFRAQGVRGTRAEIQGACAPYGYHPLALRLLAGMIVRDPAQPGDVSVAAEYSPIPDLVPWEHHILALAYDAVRPTLRELLSRLAAFRSPMDFEAVEVVSPFEGEGELKQALWELVERGLLFFDRERGRYDLHPIVRQYAYDRLANKAGIHMRLRDYFATVPEPKPIQSPEDLAPVIELYYHTVRAGQYDKAFELFRDRLHNLLYYRFGAYQTCIELLRSLVPDSDDRPSRLKDETGQAWTANALAASYSRTGQPRRAASVWLAILPLTEGLGEKSNFAVGLGNLAEDQLELGELRAAEWNLRRKIEMNVNELDVAVGHQELGRLLVCRGTFDEAEKEIRLSSAYCERISHQQGFCQNLLTHSLLALLTEDAGTALETARRARELTHTQQYEHSIIEAEWLLGAALVALASKERDHQDEALAQAETHLTEALTRCRRSNLVELEPEILLEWARWHYVLGNSEQAHKDAYEALVIADRCEYRLKQADVHNFLARLALDEGDRKAARQHATTAYERAWCDGPPHCYKPALDEAERLLKQLGVEPPRIK